MNTNKKFIDVHLRISKQQYDFIQNSSFSFSKLVRKTIQNLIDVDESQ